jgi:hypothetical protein
MTARRSITDYQQAGFGGLSFATNLNFMNLPMTYEQRLWTLEGLYACALAKVENDDKYKTDADVEKLTKCLRGLLDQATKDYQSKFEDHKTNDDSENKYRRLLTMTFEKITELQGKTKMIERSIVEQDAVY